MNSAFPGRIDLTKRLAGQIAVVTGGSRGIGQAIARRLSSEGASVAILARNESNARAAAAELAASGGQAIAISCDVTSREQVQSAVDAVTAHFGRLTVLVNDAGIFRPSAFVDMTDRLWAEILGTNLTGMFVVGQIAARQMIKQGSGRIVNVSSSAAHIAHSDQTAYAVSKAGIEAMTRSMAFELAPFGITVNAVAPGTIETSFSVGALSKDAITARTRRIPVGRLGQAEEVAAVVAFLASADASYMTGSVVSIDGGLVIGGVRSPH